MSAADSFASHGWLNKLRIRKRACAVAVPMPARSLLETFAGVLRLTLEIAGPPLTASFTAWIRLARKRKFVDGAWRRNEQ